MATPKWKQAPVLDENNDPLVFPTDILAGARNLDAKRSEKAFDKLTALKVEVAGLLEELRSVQARRPTYAFEIERDPDGHIKRVRAIPED
jgi:hypothetical protein